MVNSKLCNYKNHAFQITLRKVGLYAWVLLALLLTPAQLKADIWNDTIHVEEQTTDFNQARKNAISQYRIQSLNRVLAKVVPLDNLGKVKNFVDNSISYYFEDKLKILNEELTNNTYSVDINYYFNKTKIIDFLVKNNISYISSLHNSVLVIPLLNNQPSPDNSWQKLWITMANSNSYYSTIKVPELYDAIDVSKVLEQDQAYLDFLRSTYQVDNVIVASITPVASGEQTLTPTETNAESNLSSATSGTVSNNPQPHTPLTNQLFNISVYSLVNNTVIEWPKVSLSDAASLSMAAAEDVVTDKTVISPQSTEYVIFKVVYKSFVDWVAIYNYFKTKAKIDDLVIMEMSNNYAIIKFKFYGDLTNIIKAAYLRNIVLNTSDFSIRCNGFCY